MQQITLYQYLAFSDPNTQQAIMDLIQSKGYDIRPRDANDLTNDIVYFVGEEGDEGFDQLMMLHPDRNAILRTAPDNSHKMNADAGAVTMAPITMQVPVAAKNSDQTNHTSTIVLGLIGIVALGVVGMVISKN